MVQTIETFKDEFIERVEQLDIEYDYDDINEFASEFLQSINSIEQNIKDFVEWVGVKNAN